MSYCSPGAQNNEIITLSFEYPGSESSKDGREVELRVGDAVKLTRQLGEGTALITSTMGDWVMLSGWKNPVLSFQIERITNSFDYFT